MSKFIWINLPCRVIQPGTGSKQGGKTSWLGFDSRGTNQNNRLDFCRSLESDSKQIPVDIATGSNPVKNIWYSDENHVKTYSGFHKPDFTGFSHGFHTFFSSEMWNDHVKITIWNTCEGIHSISSKIPHEENVKQRTWYDRNKLLGKSSDAFSVVRQCLKRQPLGYAVLQTT